MLAVSALAAYACPALAQQRQPAPAQQPSSEWSRMPRMELERQFAGPLQDTIVQRWRDPVDGTICYIYLPITAEHTQPNASGFVQYGANTIGSVSCLAAPASAQAKPAPLPRAQRPPAATDGNGGDQKAAH
jgi:hypothetical protein